MSASNVCEHVKSNLKTVYKNVRSWGSGDSGQLGHESLRDCLTPKPIEALRKESIVCVSAGTSHTLALSDTGRVYSWGYGGSGQLGWSTGATPGSHTRPGYVKHMADQRVTQISCGYAHTAALTDAGEVFTWGDGYWGQLGHGVEQDESVPASIGALSGHRAVQISCGWSHTAALTAEGQLFICGRGSWGDVDYMGRCNDEARFTPRRVKALDKLKVKYVACGGLHTVAITRDDRVFLLGFQNDTGLEEEATVLDHAMLVVNEGTAGPGTSSTPTEGHSRAGARDSGHHSDADTTPVMNPPPVSKSKVVEIEVEELPELANKGAYLCACGGHHSLVLTEDAEVYAFGKGDFGQLGLGKGINSKTPRLIESLSNRGVNGLACGAYHSAAVTDDGRLLVWGGGWYGQLGTGKVQVQAHPSEIPALQFVDVRSVSCGYYHTAAITTHYLDILAGALRGEASETQKHVMFKLLSASSERAIAGMHARALAKLQHDIDQARPAMDRMLTFAKGQRFSIPAVEVSHHILNLWEDVSAPLPLHTDLTDTVVVTNRLPHPIELRVCCGPDHDMNALPHDFVLHALPTQASLLPGEQVELTVVVQIFESTCDDIIVFVDVQGGAGLFLVAKVGSVAGHARRASSLSQTANTFKERESPLGTDEVREDLSALLVLKE